MHEQLEWLPFYKRINDNFILLSERTEIYNQNTQTSFLPPSCHMMQYYFSTRYPTLLYLNKTKKDIRLWIFLIQVYGVPFKWR